MIACGGVDLRKLSKAKRKKKIPPAALANTVVRSRAQTRRTRKLHALRIHAGVAAGAASPTTGRGERPPRFSHAGASCVRLQPAAQCIDAPALRLSQLRPCTSLVRLWVTRGFAAQCVSRRRWRTQVVREPRITMA